MIAIKDNPRRSYPSHAAILGADGVICFQCRRIESKKTEIAEMPFFRRWRARIDSATGIFSAIKKTRGSVNKWWYLTVCGNTPHGRA